LPISLTQPVWRAKACFWLKAGNLSGSRHHARWAVVLGYWRILKPESIDKIVLILLGRHQGQQHLEEQYVFPNCAGFSRQHFGIEQSILLRKWPRERNILSVI